MTNWSTKKLGDITERLNLEKAPIDSRPYVEIGDINLENKSIIFKDKKSIKGAVIAPKNSVLVSRVRPTRGAIVLIDKNYPVSSAFTILKAKQSETSSKFLFYWISNFKKFFIYLQSRQKGSNYPSVREKDILNFEIPLPPLNTQKQIVAQLDKIAEAQKLNDDLIQKSDELFQSLLYKELNPAGKDWGVKKLVEILKPQYGYTTAAKEAGNYRFIRITDIGDDGELRDFDKKYVTLKLNEAKNYQLRNGDLLLARTGATFGKILYFKENEPSIFASFLIRLNPDTSINPFYIWLFSRSQSYWRQAKSLMTGSGQPQFNANKLKQIKIPLPPLEAQKQIVAKLSAVQEYKTQLLAQKSKLKELFDSVLNKSISGNY